MESFKPDEQETDLAETQISAEQARMIEWFSSNTGYGGKTTPEGKTVFGLSLTTNPEYAQSYSRTKKVNVFRIPNAKLKPVSFDYGMTIDDAKK